MASVEETIAWLCLAYDDNLISEEQFVLVYDEIITNTNSKHSYTYILHRVRAFQLGKL